MFNVKVVLDNKLTQVFQDRNLVHQGERAKDRAFGLNVIYQGHPNAQKWSEVKWSKEGHKDVCYLTE